MDDLDDLTRRWWYDTSIDTSRGGLADLITEDINMTIERERHLRALEAAWTALDNSSTRNDVDAVVTAYLTALATPDDGGFNYRELQARIAWWLTAIKEE